MTMDYTELVKRLSERSVFMFPHHGESHSYDADLMHEAADAIEELQKHYCRHAIHNKHDRGDDSLCDVLMTEPPKEKT